ncbi:MFS transporter [Halobacillus yeomjeoni]|uniref:MFS transporter n=1 Tax=Halobacillus yeomjeoni TaxID=311194 RepID=A0A931HUH3_9BACI|nr:MFS transporter [Halobacillus yeomjeoni]MBH0229749.1 MFS transporter [Halobacillus yeomjeoni]
MISTALQRWTAREDKALAFSSFRKFLYGSFIVRSADWMDLTILNWLVYQWTGSAVALGIVNACRLIPIIFFSLHGGVLADRYDRKKILLICYGGIILSTVLLAYLAYMKVAIVLFYGAIVLRSLFMTIEVPVRNAFLADLVDHRCLPNAISLQTMVINLARMVGPALAGWLLVKYSASELFIVVAAGMTMILFLLPKIEVTQNRELEKKIVKEQKNDWKETFRYIRENRLIVSILLIAIAPMVFGFPYTTMLPLFADELMVMGPDGFGLLLSVSSIGAIISTMILSIKKPTHQGKVLVLSALGFGLCLGFFILFRESYLISLILILIVGFTSQLYRTMSRITLQMNVEETLRGRVLSVALMDRAYIPLGSLLIGFIAGQFGAVAAGLFMGMGCFAITLLIAWQRPGLWKT